MLWLFTDAERMADPVAALALLPKGLCGVVLRHSDAGERARLAGTLTKLCRARRLALVIAGDARLAARHRAGVHLRGGQWPGVPLPRGLVTSSAHNPAELRRARRAGADIIFLSPALPTASHAGMPALGPVRWAALARSGGVYALGGINAGNVRRLGRRLAGVGAIGAFAG